MYVLEDVLSAKHYKIQFRHCMYLLEMQTFHWTTYTHSLQNHYKMQTFHWTTYIKTLQNSIQLTAKNSVALQTFHWTLYYNVCSRRHDGFQWILHEISVLGADSLEKSYNLAVWQPGNCGEWSLFSLHNSFLIAIIDSILKTPFYSMSKSTIFNMVQHASITAISCNRVHSLHSRTAFKHIAASDFQKQAILFFSLLANSFYNDFTCCFQWILRKFLFWTLSTPILKTTWLSGNLATVENCFNLICLTQI